MKRIPKLYHFKNDAEKEPYIIKHKEIADSWAVSMNNLYRQMNPDLPELVVGQEYEIEEKPYGYFKYKKQIWPVYDDDPGQQSYIYYKGKCVGGGSWTTYPFDVEYFCFVIYTDDGKDSKALAKWFKQEHCE